MRLCYNVIEFREGLAEEDAGPVRALVYIREEVTEEPCRLAATGSATIEQLIHEPCGADGALLWPRLWGPYQGRFCGLGQFSPSRRYGLSQSGGS